MTYRYRLTLEVEDHGARTFSGAAETDRQHELAEKLAYDIERMLSILNDPPTPEVLVEAISEEGEYSRPLQLMALLHRHWDGEESIEDVFTVSVDLDKLCASADDDEKATVVYFLEKAGWTWTSETYKSRH